MRNIEKVLALLLAILAGFQSGPAYAGTARFWCGNPASGWCYFTIFYESGGHRNFTLRANTADFIPGLRHGDTYCIDTTGIPRDNCQRQLITGIRG